MKRQTLTRNVKVTRTKGDRVKLSLTLAFDPAVIGQQRTALIFEGVGKAIAGILTPEEALEFMAELERQKQGLETHV